MLPAGHNSGRGVGALEDTLVGGNVLFTVR
jgi:hypothetical protein